MNSSQFKLLLVIQIITLFLVGALFFKTSTNNSGGKPFGNATEKGATAHGKITVAAGNNFVYGKPEAKNELIVITRYNCGFCRDFYNLAFDSLMNKYVNTGKLKIIFIDNVSTDDKKGMLMAKVAEAAHQLNVYETVQASLYNGNQPQDSTEIIERAIAGGLSKVQLSEKLSKPDLIQNILNDNKEVDRLHITGTPTFVINGNVVVGFKGYNEFMGQIEQLMKP